MDFFYLHAYNAGNETEKTENNCNDGETASSLLWKSPIIFDL